MGYAVLHLEKAKRADSGMSAHIERTIQSKNTDPTRTHLNRELIQFPDGVRNRTAAIQHHLNTAGQKRKIGKNQVQAIRIVLTGTHADMEQIEQMAAYGLQRGVKGSEAQHISTHEYYRSLIAQGEDLQANITQLLKEQEKAKEVIAEAEQTRKDFARIKAEAKTEKLKNSATKTATTALNGLNSLLGDNKVNRLEKENAQLHREVEDLNEQIERLHTDMQKLNDNHARELNRTNEKHQQEVNNLKRLIDKTYKWFPSFKRFFNMEHECLDCGFNMEQTNKLLYGHAANYSGWLHSNEYRRNVLADNVTAQVIRDEKRNLFLHINQTPIAQWFKGAIRDRARTTERNQTLTWNRGRNTISSPLSFFSIWFICLYFSLFPLECLLFGKVFVNLDRVLLRGITYCSIFSLESPPRKRKRANIQKRRGCAP